MNILKETHVLFVLEKPPCLQDGKEDLRWVNFRLNVLENNKLWPWLGTTMQIASQTQLAENVWLFALKDGEPFLGRLVAGTKLEGVGLTYKYLVLDEPPHWQT